MGFLLLRRCESEFCEKSDAVLDVDFECALGGPAPRMGDEGIVATCHPEVGSASAAKAVGLKLVPVKVGVGES